MRQEVDPEPPEEEADPDAEHDFIEDAVQGLTSAREELAGRCENIPALRTYLEAQMYGAEGAEKLPIRDFEQMQWDLSDQLHRARRMADREGCD